MTVFRDQPGPGPGPGLGPEAFRGRKAATATLTVLLPGSAGLSPRPGPSLRSRSTSGLVLEYDRFTRRPVWSRNRARFRCRPQDSVSSATQLAQTGRRRQWERRWRCSMLSAGLFKTRREIVDLRLNLTASIRYPHLHLLADCRRNCFGGMHHHV